MPNLLPGGNAPDPPPTNDAYAKYYLYFSVKHIDFTNSFPLVLFLLCLYELRLSIGTRRMC